MNKEGLGFRMALFLFFLASTSWAQLDRSAEPLWRALGLVPPSTVAPLPACLAESFGGGPQLDATCTADCGASAPVSCSSPPPGSCTAVDQNCPVGQRGYVVCGSTRTYCPDCCDQFDTGSCNYSWDPDSGCCLAPSSPPAFCVGICW